MFVFARSPRRGGRNRTKRTILLPWMDASTSFDLHCRIWSNTTVVPLQQVAIFGTFFISTRFCTRSVRHDNYALSKVTCTTCTAYTTYSSLPHNGGATRILYFFRVLLYRKRACKTHATLFPRVLCQSQLRKSTHPLLLPSSCQA